MLVGRRSGSLRSPKLKLCVWYLLDEAWKIMHAEKKKKKEGQSRKKATSTTRMRRRNHRSNERAKVLFIVRNDDDVGWVPTYLPCVDRRWWKDVKYTKECWLTLQGKLSLNSCPRGLLVWIQVLCYVKIINKFTCLAESNRASAVQWFHLHRYLNTQKVYVIKSKRFNWIITNTYHETNKKLWVIGVSWGDILGR